MNILGISCFYHDSSACLMRDGQVVAAAQEERFDREKGSPGFPRHAINSCLQQGGITALDLDHVAFYEQPFLKFHRVLVDHARHFPFSFRSFMRTMPHWLSERLDLPLRLRKETGYKGSTLFIKHHLAHAASAYFLSPFDEAAILTVDGVGEYASTTWGRAKGQKIEILKEIRYPDSLGLLYTAITTWLGFEANRGEGKVMALADYGEPAYLDELRKIVTVLPDGSYRLDPEYFNNVRGRSQYTPAFLKRFGPPRVPKSALDQRYKDMAASLQKLLEQAMFAMAVHVHKQTGLKNLCIAGGVGLNCAANDRILSEGPYERIFIPPAAGDSGAALGAAAYAMHALEGVPRRTELRHALLGPEFSEERMKRAMVQAGLEPRRMERAQLLEHVARRIGEGRVVGWFQGRMEFGPRALGARSILADPRVPDMKARLNDKVKHRESFRPYGASVLEEKVGEWFEHKVPSPFMLFAYPGRAGRKDVVPSALHVNGTCRLQTVNREVNGIYYDLIAEFERQTGIPMVINTSFNDNNEPIVCSPEDACACFQRSQMDDLVIGPFVAERATPAA